MSEEVKEEVKRDYRQERENRSRQLILDFGDAVNKGADTEVMLDQYDREHRTLQQSMFREIIAIICHVANDNYRTDGRNEESKAMAKKFIAGYAEVIKQEEKQRLLKAGYDDAKADEKADVYKKEIIATPEKYLGIRYI